MKPTVYLNHRKAPLGGMLKVLLLVCLSSFTSLLYGQEYFYYYKGEKKPLTLNTKFVYLVTSSSINDAESLQKMINGSEVTQFKSDNSEQTVKVFKQPETHNWAEVQLTKKLTAKSYLTYLSELEANADITEAAPYFTDSEGEKVGLSEYLYVKLKNDKDLAILTKMASELGAEIVGQNKFMPQWFTLRTQANQKLNALEIANKLYESGAFAHAEPDFLLENMTQSSNDPLLADQWGLKNTGQYGGSGIDIKAFDAWDITKGSREVQVAVLDHGFEMNHPDLSGNTFGTGFDTGTGTSPAQVLGSHGTACAGIIAASQDNHRGVSGVAPNAQLISISNSLYLTPTVKQELADGINWAWQNGAEVISNSWGHTSLASALIDNAITNALNNGRGGLGTIVVFAAGNGNGNVSYPANSNPDIISVGAMSPCGERKSPSSCDGEGWGSDYGVNLDVMAPGVLISTTDRQGASGYNPSTTIHPNLGGTLVTTDYTDDDYTIWFNGTSSACPMVAGVAALILSVNDCLTHDEVEDIIEQTAQKVGGYAYGATAGRPNGTWHNEMGYGLVDAEAAVIMAQSMLPTAVNYDIYSKDRPFDTGVEPNPDNGPMWISQDIWVRQSLDGGTKHQNPEYKLYSPNGVYVKVTNRSSVTSECANLSLYFSKASTGLVWPTNWINYNLAGVLNGDKINTVSIPPIAPGATKIIEIPWYPPNPADFVNDIHHFCLLARIESPTDPMYNEQTGVGVGINVKNNNNIAWKNIQVYDNILNISSLYIRGIIKGWSFIDLKFYDRGFQEKISKPFFERGGKVAVKVEPKLFERIKEARLEGVKIVGENMLHIQSPGATIYGIQISSKETFTMDFAFDVDVDPKEEGVILDVLQMGEGKLKLQGGERFVIKASRKGGKFDTPVVEKTELVYPNPSEGEIYLKYEIQSDDVPVSVNIKNALEPAMEQQLFKGKQSRGEHIEQYDVSRLKNGVYILTIKIGEEVKTERIVINNK
ncbi:S8 family serine peptidase [Fulvivirga ligni]|uniref:S8 family serine peptidase n=1 Tax=Fulvivirga ligni TaxID=2904246 RepID=UPI001F441444|nr:S8 family serine peptidase [Fulvivirga ligni]UII19089.1 S8 family serine peptidase [Fulvivirga ligni]